MALTPKQQKVYDRMMASPKTGPEMRRLAALTTDELMAETAMLAALHKMGMPLGETMYEAKLRAEQKAEEQYGHMTADEIEAVLKHKLLPQMEISKVQLRKAKNQVSAAERRLRKAKTAVRR
jgi:hypothetical protein